MPTPTETSYAELEWTGFESAFNPGFRAGSIDDVRVRFRHPDGVVTPLTNGIHITVLRNDSTEAITVTPLAMPPAPGAVEFERITPAIQDVDFDNLEGFDASVHTRLFDRIFRAVAEAKRLSSIAGAEVIEEAETAAGLALLYRNEAEGFRNQAEGFANETKLGTIQIGSFTANGAQTVFDLGTAIGLTKRLLWWENGVRQVPEIDYTTSGTQATRLTPPVNGAAIHWLLLGDMPGRAGVDGTQWYLGDSDPSNLIGRDGDLYEQFGVGVTGGIGDVWLKAGGVWTIVGNHRGPAGTGNMTGPVSSTDNALVRFDGTTGTLVQNSPVSITDAGLMTVSLGSSGVSPSAAVGFTLEKNGQLALLIATPNNTSGSIYFGDPENNVVGRVEYSHSTNTLSLWASNTSVMTVTNTVVNLSTAKFQEAGVPISPFGKHTIWVPAGAMIPHTTNGAALNTVATGSGIMLRTLDFDTTTQEFAQFQVRMPKSWNRGTVTFIPLWSHVTASTNFGVVWGVEAVAIGDDDTLGASFGTAQTSTDTGGTAGDLYQGPESAAITIAGSPAENDLVVFQIKRVPADAADNLAVDARLHGIVVLFTINAATDA